MENIIKYFQIKEESIKMKIMGRVCVNLLSLI